MIQHISLCFCVCSIACVHIVGDCIGFFYHFGEGFVGFQQLFGGFIFFYFIDVGIMCGVVCVVIAVQLLTQEVLWVAVVCTPTIVNEGLEVCLYNFLTQALNEGLDVQLDEIITKAVGEYLFENVSAVQSSLAGSEDVVICLNREGNSLCTQFFHCLFLVLFCLCLVQSCRGLSILFFHTHCISYQFNIVFAVRGVAQTLHGVVVVLTDHWVDGVESLEVVAQIQTVPPYLTEGVVCDCLVPVVIRCAVILHLVVVEVELEGTFLWSIRYHVVVQRIAWVFCDGVDARFAQTNIVYLAVFVQLVADVAGLGHLKGDCIKKGTILIPVHWVFGVYLLVALQVFGHGVAAIVPHGFVVDCAIRFRTHLLYQSFWSRIQAVVGS